jgi:hypothetical protein
MLRALWRGKSVRAAAEAFMRRGVALARAAAVVACWLAAGPVAARALPTLEAHVLARAGYGADAWSRQRIAALGVDAYLEEQLHPDSIRDDALDARLAGYTSLSGELPQLLESFTGAASELPLREASRARLLRAIFSRRQLEQQLVDFWYDHFNVFAASGRTQSMSVVPYERASIRPHVLGRFEQLLRAVAVSPAMLYYLDNCLNVKEGFYSASGPRTGLNENYARELLELHTVGSESGFTQADVVDTARALSGWRVQPPPSGDAGSFLFFAPSHDQDAKRVLGLRLPPGGGLQEGFELLAYLARHPSTARRVCFALTRRFVSETPPVLLVGECAQVFLSSGGDLRAVTRFILFSRQFREPSLRGSKLKRPVVFVASLLRAMGARPDDRAVDELLGYLGLLGEAPFMAHPPSGYPDDSSHWSGAGAMLTRFALVAAVTEADAGLGIGGIGELPAPALVDALAARLLGAAPMPATRAAAIAGVESLGAAQGAARAREAAALLLASPDFMQH